MVCSKIAEQLTYLCCMKGFRLFSPFCARAALHRGKLAGDCNSAGEEVQGGSGGLLR